MKKYKIEHKILTLAHCAVMDNKEKPASFLIEDIEFSHWNFSHRDGWKTDAWIASAEIQVETFIIAINYFRAKLTKIIPRISLISQSYIEFTREPFIIHDLSKDVAFFEYSEDVESVGLMFMENDQEALVELLKHNEIPEAFYYYWNDAVNVEGYSAKLLLMFSAIEALTKKDNKKDLALLDNILGKELVKELFERDTGLRHRLVHGEYFGSDHKGKNYFELIHKKIINHFNSKVLSKHLIHEDVIHPQRHFFGNKQGGRYLVKRKDGIDSFPLKELLEDFSENGFRTPDKFEHVFDNELVKTY